MDLNIKALGCNTSFLKLGLVASPYPFASYFVTNKKAINGRVPSPKENC